MTFTAKPRQSDAPEPADERGPTQEQRLWRLVLYTALSDAYNGGGSRTKMDQRCIVQKQARDWWKYGNSGRLWPRNWRDIAGAADLHEARVIRLLKRAGLAHLLAEDKPESRLMRRLDGRLSKALRNIQRQAQSAWM